METITLMCFIIALFSFLFGLSFNSKSTPTVIGTFVLTMIFCLLSIFTLIELNYSKILINVNEKSYEYIFTDEQLEVLKHDLATEEE
jgi:uncharacterized membrane protein